MRRKGNLFKTVTADVLKRTITNTSLVLDSTRNCELLSYLCNKVMLRSVNCILFFAACYKEPAPPVCPIPCPSACAPSCYDTCCQQGYPMGYQQPYYMPPPPPVPVPVPVAGTCPNSCPNTCAPVGCTPACCNTVYNPAPYQYGKRHHAPRPVKGSKKHHIFHKLHRKNWKKSEQKWIGEKKKKTNVVVCF